VSDAVKVTLHSDHDGKSKEEVLTLLDAEVERFSIYMSQIDSPARGALSNPEKALMKTYLVAKLRERL
jgi:hypothetical protein